MGIKRRWSREMEGNIFKAAQTSIGNQRRKVRLFMRPLCVVNVRKGQKEKDCEPPKRKSAVLWKQCLKSHGQGWLNARECKL